jgi:hypothetical protein
MFLYYYFSVANNELINKVNYFIEISRKLSINNGLGNWLPRSTFNRSKELEIN